MTFKRSHDTRDGGVVTLGGCQFLQPSPKRACVGDLAGDYQAVGIAPITPSPQFECSRTDSNMDCDCDPARPVSAVMASAAFDSLRPVSFFLSTPSPAPATPAFAPPQSEALWRCVSEFNFILEANFNRLPSNGLTAYHSYTRGRKDAVWQAFCRSQGAPSAAAGGILPPLLSLVGYSLQSTLAPYDEASIVLVSFRVPAWLEGWCVAHGQGGNGVATAVLLHAYGSNACQQPGAKPARTLFVPLLAGLMDG